jgi:hypothetical protein
MKMSKIAKKAAKKSTKTAAPVEVQKIPMGMTAAKAAKALAKLTNAPVAEKAAAKVAPVSKPKKTPNQLMEKLIALMVRKDGATIQDFQQVEGFNIPSMAVVKAARRLGYEADASKVPGERTRYIAKRAAS